MFHAQELGSYAQGQGSLAVFKVTARDQGRYKGPSGAFVTYCNISCLYSENVVACTNTNTKIHKWVYADVIKLVGLA